MGNSSSVIPSKLEDLAGIAHSGGDVDAARMLRQVSGSQSLITLCRGKLILENWIRQTGDDIPRRIYDWISYPNSKFWGFTGFREDTKLVAYCVSDVDEGESSSKMDPVRRRVMLVILYDIIQKEKQRLQAEAEKCKAKKRKACNNTLKKPVPNNGSFLTQAIKNIINQTYCS
ncbi:hypothetical protein BDV40DRAFT_294502 [Aspergillus tamarii]|uniref:Uncharacterized protein n=1 Tax=Aspergillus tamarii TaxID=41984 RepID=A0A5N6VBY8_ASPTM|nr:hypothetical protein BDV40DRAFT_294502 [Aspergillus tamarii]